MSSKQASKEDTESEPDFSIICINMVWNFMRLKYKTKREQIQGE